MPIIHIIMPVLMIIIKLIISPSTLPIYPYNAYYDAYYNGFDDASYYAY